MQYGKNIPSSFQNKHQGKLEYSTNTRIFKMYDPWQGYTFGTRVFNFLYVTALNAAGLDTLGLVQERPLSRAGVTSSTQTHNFGSSAPSQSSPCTQQNKSGQFCRGLLNPPPQKPRKDLFISIRSSSNLQHFVPNPRA